MFYVGIDIAKNSHEVSVIDSNVKNNLLARNHEKEEISKTIEIILVALNKKTCSCQFYFNEDYVNKEDDDTYDLQKELEAKFDELFGPIEDDDE